MHELDWAATVLSRQPPKLQRDSKKKGYVGWESSECLLLTSATNAAIFILAGLRNQGRKLLFQSVKKGLGIAKRFNVVEELWMVARYFGI